MKKLKCVIALLAALAFAVPFAGCKKNPSQGNGDKNPIVKPDETIPHSLSVDTSKAKLLYDMDEEFTTEGLVVTLVRDNLTQGVFTEPEIIQHDDNKLDIDFSQFKKGVAGTYTITLTYTEGYEIANTYYTVTVQKSAGVFIEKTKIDYDFVLAGTEIDLSDITVKMATAVAGPKGEALTSDKYSIKCFDSAQNEVEFTGGKLILKKSGTYQIWAFVDNYTIPGTTETDDLKAFVLINAIDEIASIKFNDTAEGTVTTQPKSVIDHISETWKFTATYKSGYSEQIGKCPELEIGINTNRKTTKGSARVSYTYTNCIGEKTKAETTVSYIITDSLFIPEVHELSMEELKDKKAGYADNDHNYFTAADFETMKNNAFFTVINTDANFQGIDYRGKQDRLEIRGEVFEIDFKGVGMVEVEAASTGGSNTSAFYLVDEEGNYMPASNFVASSVSFKDDFENIYAISGTSQIKFTFIITQSGKYRLCTAKSVSKDGAPQGTDRPLKLTALSVTMEKDA